MNAPPAIAPAGPPLPASLATVVFASCLQPSKPAPILGPMAEVGADLAVFLGDNVYGDALAGDVTLPELRQAYTALAGMEAFGAFAASTPIVATWDDHDYGMNDAGASFTPRRFAERIFETFWRLPEGDPRRSRPGVYHAQAFGAEGQRVQVVLLDTRWSKGPWTPATERGPGKERYVPTQGGGVPMLGEDQWRWLGEVLQEPADVRLIVSSLQVHAEGHGWERWGLLPEERDRLYAALAARAESAVVLISGDRHRAGIYERPDLPGGPYPEMTTSSLNLSFGGDEEAGPHRLGPTFTGENFGVLTFDWEAGTARLSVRDAAGEEVLGHDVEL